MNRAGAALDRARRRRPEHLRMLATLIRFRTVGADPAGRPELVRCAAWLTGRLRELGLAPIPVPAGGGPPLVVARAGWRPGRPHVLLYGHYDVQPAAGQEWRTPPFALVRRGAELHGRGASDNKGPITAHLAAIAAVTAVDGRLPVNLTVVLDGEEEVGSPHLAGILTRAGATIAGPGVDAVVVSDTRMLGPDRPALVYSLRGSITAELRIARAGRPLHVGAWAGRATNPAQRLADLVSALGDRSTAGAFSAVRLAAGTTPQVMAIPSAATATVNLRTEPGTRTDQIVAELRRQVGAAASHDVSARMRLRSAVDPVRLPRRSPAMAVAAEAYRRGFGRPPVFVRSGGTIAAVGLLRRFLGAPVLMMGFSLPDDGAHGPDERIRLAVLWRAVDTSVFLLYGLGSLDPHDQTSPMDIVLSGNPGIVR